MVNPELKEVFANYALELNNYHRPIYRVHAKNLLKELDEKHIPGSILLKANCPWYYPWFHEQQDGDSCGLNALRGLLMVSYGEWIAEKTLKEVAEKKLKVVIKDNGIDQQELGDLIEYIDKTRINKGLRTFVSEKGTQSNLVYLTENHCLPIIHRCDPDPEIGEHYELVIGLNKRYVFLFDSARGSKTKGFHKIKRSNFHDFWYYDNERFYLAAINGLNLPPTFKGEYLD